MMKSLAHNGSRLALFKLLYKLGLIPQEAIAKGLAEKEFFPIAFLARKGILDETAAIHQVAVALEIKIKELNRNTYKDVLQALDSPILASMPASRWNELKAVPYAIDETTVYLAMANPLDHESISALSFDLGKKIDVAISKEEEILSVLGMRQNAERNNELQALFEDAPQREEKEENTDANLSMMDQGDAPIIRIVNKIMSQAIELNASDIHLNPEADKLNIRARVDGIMRFLFSVPKSMKDPVISRIKLMGGMDISERRKPQDGRLRVQSHFGTKDLRLSSVPTAHGENIVIRILSVELPLLSFDMLGMADNLRSLLESSLDGTSRVILVTGPTGSGKTSTLYSSLSHLNNGSRNIITVEDPIEYRIPGISQIQVNSKVGLGFAEGLRSILRQDPDVIMVGEIRDTDTASIAIQAAQTGHLVLSTIHTNSAVSAITRLRDLGIQPFLISSSLGCIVSQRLVRRTCPACASPANAEEYSGMLLPGVDPQKLVRGRGCDECSQTGYKGRLGVFSVLPITRKVRELIRNEASEAEIEKAAHPAGFQSLWDSGIALINSGLTSFEEVERVLGREDPPSPEMLPGEMLSSDTQLPPQPQSKSALKAGNNGSIAKRKVLLVEDDDDIRTVLAILLHNNLYDVSEAVNGLDALEKVYAAKPDVIVCDLMMPQLGGMDFVRRLRNDSRIAEIPVLILTAANSDQNQINSLQTGADDFVSKTSDSKILLARIERLLQRVPS